MIRKPKVGDIVVSKLSLKHREIPICRMIVYVESHKQEIEDGNFLLPPWYLLVAVKAWCWTQGVNL